jgi:drug/metabolite transporter (DMT)-like permease
LHNAVSSYLLAALAPLFWSSNFILGRALNQTIPPIALSFWRWALALLIVLPFGLPRVRSQWGQVRRHWAVLSLLAVLGVTNFNTFVYLGLQTTTATNAVLLVSATPVLIVLLSFVLLRQRVSPRQAAGILLSLGGVAVIIARGDPGALGAMRPHAGDFWVLGAVASWALYSVCLRWRPSGLDSLAFLTVTMAIGLIPLLTLYGWELGQGLSFGVTAVSLGAIVYVALCPSVLAYILWNHAVAELGANRTGQLLHLMPAFGAVLAMALLGERMHGFHVAGIGLITAGIGLSTRAPRKGLAKRPNTAHRVPYSRNTRNRPDPRLD